MENYEEKYKLLLALVAPKTHWTSASRSLVGRLRGIYAIGPNADQMSETDEPEFGWRKHDNMPPIQFEAAQRIQELENELARLNEILEDCPECVKWKNEDL